LAGVLAMQGRDIEAEEELRQLLNGDVEIPSQDRIRYVRDLSKALRRQGKYTEADDVMQPAVQDALVYGVADLRSQIASLELGKVKLHQKAYGEAVSVLRPACNAIPNPYHQAHLECLEHLGYALKHLKCYNESMLFYTRALDGNLRMYGADHPFTRETSAKIDDYRAFLAGRTNSEEQHGQDSGVCTAVQGEITSGSLGSEPS
jgi:tetratricopeptide (TPR) repeat protein